MYVFAYAGNCSLYSGYWIYACIIIYIYIHYFIHHHCMLIPFIRHLTNQQLVSQNAKTPNINGQIIILSLQNFGWYILTSATIGLTRSKYNSRPAKITNFSNIAHSNKNILWFNISMGYRFFM